MASLRISDCPEKVRYRVTGMDCLTCASEIEEAVRQIAGVEDVKVSVGSQSMAVIVDEARRLPEVERAVTALGYGMVRTEGASSAPHPEELLIGSRHVTPAYRRALWAVVLLNVGYGVVEIAAGFIAASQALKADALDFLGDGLITLLGLLAIEWNVKWRAKSALAQGFFLGSLGIAVLGTTVYRFFVLRQPEAELMGIFGAAALAINVAAALVLIPHRKGDANVRAVWLFSRNDAVGNAAVVLAAGLVAWTNTPWPDLVVAAIIASLFLHASWTIVSDARQELGALPASAEQG